MYVSSVRIVQIQACVMSEGVESTCFTLLRRLERQRNSTGFPSMRRRSPMLRHFSREFPSMCCTGHRAFSRKGNIGPIVIKGDFHVSTFLIATCVGFSVAVSVLCYGKFETFFLACASVYPRSFSVSFFSLPLISSGRRVASECVSERLPIFPRKGGFLCNRVYFL